MSIIFLHTALLVLIAILIVVSFGLGLKAIDEKKHIKGVLYIILGMCLVVGAAYERENLEKNYFPDKEYVTKDGKHYTDFNEALEHNMDLRK